MARVSQGSSSAPTRSAAPVTCGRRRRLLHVARPRTRSQPADGRASGHSHAASIIPTLRLFFPPLCPSLSLLLRAASPLVSSRTWLFFRLLLSSFVSLLVLRSSSRSCSLSLWAPVPEHSTLCYHLGASSSSLFLCFFLSLLSHSSPPSFFYFHLFIFIFHPFPVSFLPCLYRLSLPVSLSSPSVSIFLMLSFHFFLVLICLPSIPFLIFFLLPFLCFHIQSSCLSLLCLFLSPHPLPLLLSLR